MSGAFDEFARNLATPMPRRRALRLLGGAIVAATVPGLRPRSAHGASVASLPLGRFAEKPCLKGVFCGFAVNNGYNIGCCHNPKVPFVCCNHNKETGSWCCPEGFTCGDGTGKGKGNCYCEGAVNPKTGACNCPPNKVCGKRCCDEHETCDNGECVQCDDENRCGTDCCPAGSVCRNKARSLCCVKSWKPCDPGGGGVVKCCPPSDFCCFNKKTKAVTCCDSEHVCDEGVCGCAKGTKKCGKECCKGTEVCTKEKCCPKGKFNCGDGRCCDDKKLCCGKTCCDSKAGKCIGGSCCPPNRLLGKGASAKCCPPETVVSAGGVCCPKADPNCCSEDELSVLCPKGQTCVRGTCKKL